MANDFQELLRKREERPTWKGWYYSIRRKVLRIRPRRIKGDIIHRWQRMQRGWSFMDASSADNHMHEIHIGMLRHLADVCHGWPGDEYMTFDEYVAMMREIADAFELELKVNTEWKDLTEQEKLRVDEAWKNFREWYWSFWD